MPRIEQMVPVGDRVGIILDVPPNSVGHVILLTDDELRAKIAAAIRDMLKPTPEEHTEMLLAAGDIPLERENGGLEYPPFKVFNAMLRAYAQVAGIAV